jgi:DNA mismatch endonuclease, patch repair protein
MAGELVPGGPDGEPARERPEQARSARMSTLARRDTSPELALRRQLHRRGLRYRVHLPVPGTPRRRIDIAFIRAQVAVFVDGCFWHGCPAHSTIPATNSEWWRWKLGRNRARDRDTDHLLGAQGWTVVRIWEHESAASAADRVESAVRGLNGVEHGRCCWLDGPPLTARSAGQQTRMTTRNG